MIQTTSFQLRTVPHAAALTQPVVHESRTGTAQAKSPADHAFAAMQDFDLPTETRRALTPQSLRFPVTRFGRSGPQTRIHRALRGLHRASASVASDVGRLSPSLARVERRNRAHVAALRARDLAGFHGAAGLPTGVRQRDVMLAQFTPALLDGIRDQLLGHMDDAFLTNLERNAKKAGGSLWNTISGDTRELTRTRSQLIAEMLDLDDPASPLNRALEQLAPRMFAHGPVAGMHPLELDDFTLKLAAQAMDCVMKPSGDEAARTASLIAELGETAQRRFDAIHTDAMKRLTEVVGRLPAGSPAAAVDRLVDRETKQTTRLIRAARKQVFDEFRRRNGGEFGYNTLSEQVRENCNVEYYKTLLLPGATWGAASRLVSSALTAIGGPAGLALTVASSAVLQYATAVASQASAGATGAANVDLRPFDSAVVPRGQINPQVYWNQRKLAAAVHDIGMQALHAYTQPGNPGAERCRTTVRLLEKTKGYDFAARQALAPELLALTDYQAFMSQGDCGGLDDAVPPQIRIAALLHEFADDLPALDLCGAPMTEATRRAVIEGLIAAINRRSSRAPPAKVTTIARRARLHVDELLQHSGLDHARLGAGLAPDDAALHAGGVDFARLIKLLLQPSGMVEQTLFDSQGSLRAQYRGLYVNAVAGLAVQMTIGVAAFFGVAAATAAGGPAAGFGAATGFTALSFAAGSVSRDAGAVAWYKKDREGQTDANLYRLLRAPDARPMVGDRKRHLAALQKAVLSNHVPLYRRRMDQLAFCLRAAWEKQLILGSDRQAQQGFDLLHALEQDPANNNGPRFAAELAGQALDAMHEAATVQKHQAVLSTHAAARRVVTTAGDAAEKVLQEPSQAIRKTVARFDEDTESYGIGQSYGYRRKHTRFFPDEQGRVPAQAGIDALRGYAQDCFDRYLRRHRDRAGFRVSRGELESLKTALRTPHADDGTELWLARHELQLAAAGLLADDDEPYHLGVSDLPARRAAALRTAYVRQAAEIEERQRAMRILMNDLLCLQSGRFADIQDPLGIVAGSLSSCSDAGQISRHYRVLNDRLMLTFTRSAARFASQIIPVTGCGAVCAIVVFASGGLAIAQSTAKLGAFTLHPVDAADVQGLLQHGFQPKLGSLAGPLAQNLMNVGQPQTNPATFQTSAQMPFLQGGFVAHDPAFISLVSTSAADSDRFAGAAHHWDGAPLALQAVLDFLRTDAGSTQVKLRVNRRLDRLPDADDLAPQDHMRWNEARDQSSRRWNTRLGNFKPKRYVHDLTYAKNARLHFDQVQNDRHQLGAAAAVAGQRLAAQHPRKTRL